MWTNLRNNLRIRDNFETTCKNGLRCSVQNGLRCSVRVLQPKTVAQLLTNS